MGGIANMIANWSTSINVSIAGDRDKYNQAVYTNTTIQGRLVKSENLETADVKNGENTVIEAKLYTTDSRLDINDKVENYAIKSKKECKNKNGEIEFYKYILR